MAASAQREQLETLVAQRTAELESACPSLEDTARFKRAITDHLPGRVTYWDTELVCRFANQTYLDWVGKPLLDVLGRSMAETLAADYFGDVLLKGASSRPAPRWSTTATAGRMSTSSPRCSSNWRAAPTRPRRPTGPRAPSWPT